MNDFAKSLISWYEANARTLPWRETSNPYFIWLSEVILQQTRVEQGLPYYLRFVESFPTVQSLAAADEASVLKLWQGLGYYSRARNMLETSRYIAFQLNGVFPAHSREWSRMKGVGPYTAAAIASFAYGEVIPVLDGNVARVSARLLGCTDDITRNTTRAQFIQFLEHQIPAEAPAVFNQAMMELGALICKPAAPDCARCPLAEFCVGRKKGMAAELPVKAKKARPVSRYFHYLHLVNGEKTFLRKRTATDIWQGLHEFPLIETTTPEALPECSIIYPDTVLPEKPEAVFTHRLTHQLIHAHFWKIYVNPEQIRLPSGIFEIALGQVKDFPLHRLMVRYLEQQNIETEP